MILMFMGERSINPNISISLLEDWFRGIVRDEIQNVLKDISVNDKDKEEKYLSIEEASKKLSVNRTTLDRWTKTGLLQRHKVGGRRLYKFSEIERFVDEN
jgi:excisionase family DNA binding protein